MKRFPIIVILFFLCVTFLNAQQELFLRKATIPVPYLENGGIGNFITGVDFDNDGKTDLYLVNNNINDSGNELIPRIYKYEWNGTSWDSVWAATLDIPLQNTWPALTYGDWDGDGKMEVIWGPVNNTNATTNPNPARIVVFESKGDGSDVMGVSNGSGNYLPNAKWTITTTDMFNLRPFRWFLADVDGDSQKELVFSDRASSTTGYRFGIVSVSTIPDNGNGSETWTLEYSGDGQTLASGTAYDLFFLDNTIYITLSTGTVIPVKSTGGVWAVGTAQLNVIPGGSWKSACIVDLDGNSTKEVVIASNSGTTSTKIYLLQKSGDTLATTEIADYQSMIGVPATARLYGGASGDIDGDGKLDFVFGTRDATPNASICRLKYLGGSITDPANYAATVIDNAYSLTAGRWDEIAVQNIDGVPNPEIFYTSGYGSPEKIVMLKRVSLDFETIAAVKVDANGDLQPDRVGDTVGVIGVVNSINFTASANRFSYTIQDETGGINITKGSETGGGTVFNIGDRLYARGTLAYYRGISQINLTNVSNDVVLLDSNNPVTAVPLSIEQYLANAEMYESRFIEIKGVTRKPTFTDAWPTTGVNSNFIVWNGHDSLILRIDADANLDENSEPTWPIDVKGVATQYTSSATVYNDGYQVSPNYYVDITQGVAVPPSPYFALVSPANNARVLISDSTASYTAKWMKALDLNNDALIYQFVLLKTPSFASSPLTDTLFTFTALQALGWIGTQDSLVTKWTVKVKGNEASLVSCVDTFNITLIKNFATSVNDAQIPQTFYVNQNYPNPFNPNTTIRFGLPKEGMVDLRVYNILGQEVAVLINNQMMNAGNHSVSFNGASLATGTYIYRINTGDNVVTKKMVLIK